LNNHFKSLQIYNMDPKKLPPNSLYLHDLFADVAEKIFPNYKNASKAKDKNCKTDESKSYKTEESQSETCGLEKLNIDSDDILSPDHILNKMRSFPEAPNSQILMKMKAEEMVVAGKTSDASKLFLLSQAVTFQHQVLSQFSRKLSKQVESNIKNITTQNIQGEEQDLFEDEETSEEKQKRLMLFKSFQQENIESMVNSLPSNWTVVQISCKTDSTVTRFKTTKKDISSKEGNPALTIIRLNSCDPVTIYSVEAPSSDNCLTFLQEFQDILSENSLVNKKEVGREKAKYWARRTELDNRLRVLVRSMENTWLAAAKTALLGKLVEEAAVAGVNQVVEEVCSEFSLSLSDEEKTKLETVVSGACYLTPPLLHSFLTSLLQSKTNITANAIHDITRNIIRFGQRSSSSLDARSRRHPVMIILDPVIQSLPWEVLPSLYTSKQPMSRVPSLSFLHCLWLSHAADKASVVRTGVATDNVFYLLNPDQSLPETEKRLDKAFREFSSWEGVAGQEPAPGQLAKVLASKDAFMYCGHGSGSKYLSGDDVEKLRVRAVPMLLGCSSGQLTRLGRSVDPLGTAQSYLVAASPAMLGFLWPVTDADVDQWTVEFLTHWLGGSEADLMQAAANKREAFRQFLNAAALVVYGLPLRTSQQSSIVAER